MQSCDTLILSDLHLGSEASQAQAALKMLRSIEFQRLILLGDIFCDLNFARLTKDHWNFLGYIRKLSNPKRQKEIVWVEGNHDRGLSKLMSHVVGVRVYKRYLWEFEGKRHIAVHGHQFDRFSAANGILCRMGAAAHLALQKMDSRRKLLTRTLDRLNTSWLGLNAKVRRGAFHLAAAQGAQRVFCGHSHVPAHEFAHGIEYINTGAWTTEQPSFVIIDRLSARLHFWNAAGDSILPVLPNQEPLAVEGTVTPAFS